VIAEDAGLRSVVVFNKIDLVPEGSWSSDAQAYERAGYPVLATCALDGRGMDLLRSHLVDTFSVFAGASGVGKSSLLNAVEPGLGLRIREVSRATSKGRHTTSNVTIFRLEDGIMVADTPGFRELGLWEIHPDDLSLMFPEFSDYAPHCRFTSCSHGPEPGCAVREAVEKGELDRERYESYIKLLEELRSAAG
jgi:ribosome biogenesis GTPase